MAHTSVVAVLGAGALGSAIAARLGATGHDVRIWNRTADRARAAADNTPGVTAVESIDDAVRDASVVLTVLRDGQAVTDVMTSTFGALRADAVWVQTSTVGPRSAARLADLAREHGIAYLDAPVSGSTAPARKGALVWLVSGAEEALERARPVLDVLGSAVLRVGPGVEGSALKVAVNAWMAASTVAMSDLLGLSDALGIEHATLLRALEAGPLAMPYAVQKATAMDEQSYAPGFAVQLALKDLDLAAEAATPTPLLGAVRARLEQTVAAGHAADDLAAVDYVRRDQSPVE